LPAVWNLKIPPRVQIFLWLFPQNKIMTRNTLRCRGIPKPMECSFCKEFESVDHLFFDCIVSKNIWLLVEKMFNHKVDLFRALWLKAVALFRVLPMFFVFEFDSLNTDFIYATNETGRMSL
jgi:hypothetical protein